MQRCVLSKATLFALQRNETAIQLALKGNMRDTVRKLLNRGASIENLDHVSSPCAHASLSVCQLQASPLRLAEQSWARRAWHHLGLESRRPRCRPGSRVLAQLPLAFRRPLERAGPARQFASQPALRTSLRASSRRALRHAGGPRRQRIGASGQRRWGRRRRRRFGGERGNEPEATRAVPADGRRIAAWKGDSAADAGAIRVPERGQCAPGTPSVSTEL